MKEITRICVYLILMSIVIFCPIWVSAILAAAWIIFLKPKRIGVSQIVNYLTDRIYTRKTKS